MNKYLKWGGITFVVLIILVSLFNSNENEDSENNISEATTAQEGVVQNQEVGTSEISNEEPSQVQSLSHDELLQLTKVNPNNVLNKQYKMTLYLEQAPLITDTLSEAEFMSQPDSNSFDTLLIRCNLNSEDISKLDGESAQNGIYKPYNLIVNFKEYDEVAELYYTNSDCSLEQ